MPQIRMRDAAAVLRTITQIRMRDAGNVLRTIQRIRMRDGGGVLRTVWQYFSVVLDSVFETSTNSGAASSGSVTTGTVTGTVQGGVAAFTYLWEWVSGSGSIVPTTGTANATTFTATVSDSGSPYTATYRLKVTDSNGAVTYSSEVFIELYWIDTR